MFVDHSKPYQPVCLIARWTLARIGLALALLGIGNPAFAFNPDHLQRLAETKSCPNCDLREADLRGMDLSTANLQGADLSKANLGRTDLSKADLSGGYLDWAVLRNTKLISSIL